MISSQDRDTLWISNLESNKKGDGFDGVIASINVVACPPERLVASRQTRDQLLTHEEVVCVRIRTPYTEELHQVMELAMDIAANGDRAFLWYL